MDVELFMENLDKTAKLQQEAIGILSQLNYLAKLYLTSVLVCPHGEISTNKCKAIVLKVWSLYNYVTSLADASDNFQEKGKIKKCC